MEQERSIFAGIAVDDKTTKYPEDSFRVERNEDGWKIQVAVPDVLESIPKNSEIDELLLEKTNNYYLTKDYRIFNPEKYAFLDGENRPCIVLESHVDNNGVITFNGFWRGLQNGIHTTKDEILNRPIDDEVRIMWDEAKKASEKTGIKKFDDDNVAIINVITGTAVAKYCKEHDINAAYLKRFAINDGESRLAIFYDIVNEAGIDLKGSPIDGQPYTQITSPLRRYQDLHNLRAITNAPKRCVDEISLANTMNDVTHYGTLNRENLSRYRETKDAHFAFRALASAARYGVIDKETAAGVERAFQEKDVAIRCISVAKQLAYHFPSCGPELEMIATRARRIATKREILSETEADRHEWNAKAQGFWNIYNQPGRPPKKIQPVYAAIVAGARGGHIEPVWIERIFGFAEPIEAVERLEILAQEPLSEGIQTVLTSALRKMRLQISPEAYWETYEKKQHEQNSMVLGFTALEASAAKKILPHKEWIQVLTKNHGAAALADYAKERLLKKIPLHDPVENSVTKAIEAHIRGWEGTLRRQGIKR